MAIITISFSLVALGLFLGACFNIIKGKLGLAAIMAIAAFFVGGGVAVLEAA
jgi:hypothetical protein